MPPLVTPSSQIVGTQAVFNVLLGERYKMVTKESEGNLCRRVRTNGSARSMKKFSKKVIGDEQTDHLPSGRSAGAGAAEAGS